MNTSKERLKIHLFSLFLHSSSAKHAVVLKTYNSLNRLADQDLLIPEISQKYFLSLVMKVKCRKLIVCAHIRKGIIFLLVVFIIFLMLHGSIFHETMKGIKEMSFKVVCLYWHQELKFLLLLVLHAVIMLSWREDNKFFPSLL